MVRQFAGRSGIRGVVGVVGSGEAELGRQETARPGKRVRLTRQALELGQRLAEMQSVHLLTGGGGGLMQAVCEGYFKVPVRAGVSIAVIPGEKAHSLGLVPDGGAPEEYPNPWVEIPIFTHLTGKGPSGNTGMNTRNHINIRSSNVVVALPGGRGTDAEIQIATGKIPMVTPGGCPCVLYLADSGDTIGGKNGAQLRAAGYTVVDNEDAVIAFIDRALTQQGQ